MADTYVDLALGTGANDGTSWSDAYHTTTPTQNGLTAAGAGGECFIKTDSAGTNVDTVASARTITSPGTATNPAKLIGVKSTTTNEPPVDSDLAVRGTNNLPMFRASSGNITHAGYCVASGIRFRAADRFTPSANAIWDIRACEMIWNGLFYLSDSSRSMNLIDCDFAPTSTGAYFLLRAGAEMHIEGGLLSGSVMARLIDNSPNGKIEFKGTDISNAGSTLVDLASASNFHARFINCKEPASVTYASGTPANPNADVEAVGCSSATGIGSGASVRAYSKTTQMGIVETELTAIRTGGANDGASGGYSFALTPNVNTTLETALHIATPLFSRKIAGDGTTAFTVTVNIANSGAADYNTDDVRFELFSPSADGDATHEYDLVGDIIAGSTTVITDDATSTWGSGAANAQQLSITITPDFEGEIYGRVLFSKRFASSPETLYVDPRLYIT